MSKEIKVEDATSWSDEEFEANVRYLTDRGGDSPGTAENELLMKIMTERVGEENVEEELAKVYEDKLEEVDADLSEDEVSGETSSKRGKK